MYRRHGNKLGLVFLACDLAVTAAAWVGAYLVRFALWPAPEGVPGFHRVLEGLPAVLLMAAVAYRLCGLYEVHRLRQLAPELGTICKAGALLFVLVITLTFYRRDLYESRLALAVFPALDTLGLVLARWVLHEESKRFFESVNRSLGSASHLLVPLLLFALGAVLLADGVGWLLGSPLLPSGTE